jgi:hypothetical protein
MSLRRFAPGDVRKKPSARVLVFSSPCLLKSARVFHPTRREAPQTYLSSVLSNTLSSEPERLVFCPLNGAKRRKLMETLNKPVNWVIYINLP